MEPTLPSRFPPRISTGLRSATSRRVTTTSRYTTRTAIAPKSRVSGYTARSSRCHERQRRPGGSIEMTGFADHSSRDSSGYAKFRPKYPAALFEWLATLPPRQSVAWDCGTGTGQAATMLTRYFAQVMASDPSRAQLEAAD